MNSVKMQTPSHIITCKASPEGYLQDFPDRLCDWLGYSREEIERQPIDEILDTDGRDDRREKTTSGNFETLVHRFSKFGNNIWIYMDRIITNAGDSPQNLVYFIHDISGQVGNWWAPGVRSVIRKNSLPAFQLDASGKFREVNQKMLAFTGYRRMELVGKDYETFIHADDLIRARHQFEKVLSGIAGESEIRLTINNHKKKILVTALPVAVNKDGKGVLGMIHKVARQKEAHRSPGPSDLRWRQLLRNNPQPVQVVQNGRIVYLNQSGAELYGASTPEELIGRSVTDFSHPDNIRTIERRERRLYKQKPVEPSEHKIVTLDGSEKYVEARSIPITYNGKVAIQTVLHDLTDRQKEKRQVRNSLRQKETLLKEIHHRVKNNLAVISGLLEMQIMNVDDEVSRNTLKDSQLRIRSVALIHEKLYQTEMLSDIGFDRYLKELVNAISHTYNSEKQDIEVYFDLDPVAIKLDQAIPCSLIVNEVIINCYKHAFPDNRNGKIRIESSYNNAELMIRIKDNGQGLPDDFEPKERSSLGMTIIETLAEQLEANISFRSDRGTAFELRFTI